MDIKAYAYIMGADRITIVYGMERDTYFVKISDPEQVSGWKFLIISRNWRSVFQTLATAREFATSIGYTELV